MNLGAAFESYSLLNSSIFIASSHFIYNLKLRLSVTILFRIDFMKDTQYIKLMTATVLRAKLHDQKQF